MRMRKCLTQFLTFVLLLCLTLTTAVPLAVHAEEAEQKVVRVGWFESTFCYRDQFGRRCGIDYDYQHKISAYTGWTYEYVEDSWSNLLQMLIDGEIDLLSDVSYTEERTLLMSFPELPMGSESYYIYIDADNAEITSENLASFNGKRIGVNKDSIQEEFLRDWADRNSLSIEVVPLVTEEAESMDLLNSGEIDGYASINTFGAKERIAPVCRIGSSDFFYAVNKRRPDLLSELNMALASIQEEDPYFNQRISEEKLFTTQTNAFLTPSQETYLKEHEVIRVGYLDNYLPFCSTDKETGELTGALRDYLVHAGNSLKNADLRFEVTPYQSMAAALAALKAGEIDCAFPVNFSAYDSDEQEIRLTNSAMNTEMAAVLRSSGNHGISRDEEILFAIKNGDVNVETFIKEYYPSGRPQYYTDNKACIDAVASGESDCFLISSYQVHELEETIEKMNLYSAPTGESMPLSFAVNKADRELYLILNKSVVLTNSQDMDSALVSYVNSGQRVSFTRFLKENWVAAILILTVLFGVIIFLLLQKLKAERKANEQQQLLEEAAEIAKLKATITSLLDNIPGINFTKDAETGVYLACNQAFARYAKKESPEEVIGLTAEQLFDPATAAHAAEDDKMALSMDEPYVIFEDLPDEEGNQRQIKTTKLKYTDPSGRLCVLGISQDVTDTVRIHREDATSKEAYEKAKTTGIVYSHIAQAMARGFADLYHVNVDSEEFVEYRTDNESGALTEVRRGWHFFEECVLEAEEFVHPDDREAVIKALDRKTLLAALDRNKAFVMTYRMLKDGMPFYVTMKVSRMEDDERFLILGVTDVDEQMKQRHATERMQEEQIAYARLNALAGDYLCIYVVEPETGRYREFSSNRSYEYLGQAKEGTDFFAVTREGASKVSHPDDLSRFLSAFTKENVMEEISRSGIFTISYRIMMETGPLYVQLKAAMVEEQEGPRLIVGVNNIDSQVRQEEEYVKHLAKARIEASVDALTGVKNRHAYLMAEERLNLQIKENQAPEFAVVILDVNDLKKVNDNDGHNAGDQYLRDACRIVCNTFKHSPVFRVGGDEFAVIAQGDDYASIDALVDQVKEHNEEAQRSGGIVIACGMAKCGDDTCVATVFERADQSMYENKSDLKNNGNGQ